MKYYTGWEIYLRGSHLSGIRPWIFFPHRKLGDTNAFEQKKDKVNAGHQEVNYNHKE